jgi:hypothetical protein
MFSATSFRPCSEHHVPFSAWTSIDSVLQALFSPIRGQLGDACCLLSLLQAGRRPNVASRQVFYEESIQRYKDFPINDFHKYIERKPALTAWYGQVRGRYNSFKYLASESLLLSLVPVVAARRHTHTHTHHHQRECRRS